MASLWNFITVVLAFIGFAGVPEDIQGWAEWLRVIGAWVNSGWNRGVLWLLVVALLVRSWWMPHLDKLLVKLQSLRRESSTYKSSETTSPWPSFINQSPEQILDGLSGLTTMQANREIKLKYLGRSIRVSGVVDDVDHGIWGDRIEIGFRTDGGSWCFAIVGNEWKSEALALGKDRVEVIGSIASITHKASTIRLEESQLLPPDRSVAV